MGYELIRHAGGALRHVLGVLLLAWRRVMRAAGIALVVAIVVTEIAGVLVTRHFPPYLLTHVVALALGIVVAYCVGVMVLVDELIKGTLDLVRMALGEVEAGVRAAAIIAERDVGDIWGWAQRLVVGRDAPRAGVRQRLAAPNLLTGRPAPAASGPLRASARTLGQFPTPRGTTGAPMPTSPAREDPARLRVPPRLGATPARGSAPARDETRDDIAATDAFRRTAPPTPANAHPVRADQLPRIEWAAEGIAAGAALLQSALAARARHAQEAQQAPDTVPASASTAAPIETPLAAMPPLPQRTPTAAPSSVPQDVTLSPPTSTPAAAPPTVPLAPAPAPPTVPLEPRSAVRTVPVMTDASADDTGRAALEAPAAAAAGQGTGSAIVAPAGGANDGHTESAPEEPVTWEPPTRTIVLPATEGQQAAQGNDGVWPGIGEPSGDDEPDADERGLWSRIGQALVRSTTRPLREPSGDDETAPDQRAP